MPAKKTINEPWKADLQRHIDIAHELITHGGAATMSNEDLVKVRNQYTRTIKYIDNLLTIRGEKK